MSNPLEGLDGTNITYDELNAARELLQRDLEQVKAAREDVYRAIAAGDHRRLDEFNKHDAAYKRMTEQLQQVETLTSRVQLARAAGMSLQQYLESVRNG